MPVVPPAIRDFQVLQQGNKLYFYWTNPVSDGRGYDLEVIRAEIRVLELKNKAEEGNIQSQFLKYARPVEALFPGRLVISKNQAVLTLKLEETANRQLFFAVRVKGKKGDWSAFSNLEKIEPVLVPEPPEKLRAEMADREVILHWKAPEKMIDGKSVPGLLAYNVYRAENGAFKKLNSTPVLDTRYEDKNVEFGRTYRYLVRALLASYAEAESEDSEEISFTPVDKTPPASPEGLQAFRSSEGVVLSWLPSREEDLAGYRVYRAIEGKERVLLTPELIKQVTYTDSAVEKNVVYEYSITAVDVNQNESIPAKIKVKT
ncbi:MAG: hypothetical protein H5U07_01640 [Candidatus Aminicenantes bacterium]|nr:hypothetical protein [Candidatus Aminicenantes bacterium]